MLTYIDKASLPTPFGTFTIHGFQSSDGKEHIALTYGEFNGEPVLGRIHSECLTGDALFSLRCDCGFQLHAAMEKVVTAGSGFILYLRQEGRGIGILNKIKAYHLQDNGANTVEANKILGFAADLREYSMLKPMLDYLKIDKVKLMTNNPRKVKALQDIGIEVIERVPLEVGKNKYNESYLHTKSKDLGHLMSAEFASYKK